MPGYPLAFVSLGRASLDQPSLDHERRLRRRVVVETPGNGKPHLIGNGMTEDTGNTDLIPPRGLGQGLQTWRKRGISVDRGNGGGEWCPQLSPDSTWLRSKRRRLSLSSSSVTLELPSSLSGRVSSSLQKVLQSTAIVSVVVAQGPSGLLSL